MAYLVKRNEIYPTITIQEPYQKEGKSIYNAKLLEANFKRLPDGAVQLTVSIDEWVGEKNRHHEMTGTIEIQPRLMTVLLAYLKGDVE